MATASCRLNTVEYRKLKSIARKQNISIHAIIKKLLTEYMEGITEND